MLEAYYSLDSVRYGTSEETAEFGKLEKPKRSKMWKNPSDSPNHPFPERTTPQPTPRPVSSKAMLDRETSGYPHIEEDHDVKIIETVDGTKLISIDGVLINYNDAATAIAYFASD